MQLNLRRSHMTITRIEDFGHVFQVIWVFLLHKLFQEFRALTHLRYLLLSGVEAALASGPHLDLEGFARRRCKASPGGGGGGDEGGAETAAPFLFDRLADTGDLGADLGRGALLELSGEVGEPGLGLATPGFESAGVGDVLDFDAIDYAGAHLFLPVSLFSEVLIDDRDLFAIEPTHLLNRPAAHVGEIDANPTEVEVSYVVSARRAVKNEGVWVGLGVSDRVRVRP